MPGGAHIQEAGAASCAQLRMPKPRVLVLPPKPMACEHTFMHAVHTTAERMHAAHPTAALRWTGACAAQGSRAPAARGTRLRGAGHRGAQPRECVNAWMQLCCCLDAAVLLLLQDWDACPASACQQHSPPCDPDQATHMGILTPHHAPHDVRNVNHAHVFAAGGVAHGRAQDVERCKCLHRERGMRR